MDRRTRRLLSAYATGALEPGERARLEERLAGDPDLTHAASRLRPREERASYWALPPSGLFGGPSPFHAAVGQGLSMGPGDPPLTAVRFHAPDTLPRAVVVLVRPADRPWEVLFPPPGEPPLMVHELDLRDDGERELIIGEVPADLRALALALPEISLLPRSDDAPDPWGSLRAAVEADLVPVRVLSPRGEGVFSL